MRDAFGGIICEKERNFETVTTGGTFTEIKPRTNADVLLERWAKDTESMAYATIDAYYDDEDGWFSLPDGFGTDDPDKAVEHYIAYLNSAAEVGK